MKFTYELRLSEHKFSYAFCGPVFMYQVVMNVTNECMHITMQCARRTVYLTTCSLVVGHTGRNQLTFNGCDYSAVFRKYHEGRTQHRDEHGSDMDRD